MHLAKVGSTSTQASRSAFSALGQQRPQQRTHASVANNTGSTAYAIGKQVQNSPTHISVNSIIRSSSHHRGTLSQPRASIVAMASSSSHDLLVVGPGVLGGYAGKLWREMRPDSRVIGVTNTANNHARLEKLGLQPMLKTDLPEGIKFPYVLFSAPPSGSADYPAEVASALALWDKDAPGASFVFTSSMGICAVDDGSVVKEDCPVVPLGTSSGNDKIINAEKHTLEAGGNVVRLVGLYHAQRGAHTYFLKIGTVQRPGDYVVNLLHYEDAARLAVSVLASEGSGPYKGQTFLGCDNHPVQFKDMMDACLRSPLFAGSNPVQWAVPDQGPSKSKRCDNTATRERLGGWQPKYKSFVSFMEEQGGQDFYNTSGLF